MVTSQLIAMSYLLAVRESTAEPPRTRLYAAAADGTLGREDALPRSVRRVAAAIWKRLLTTAPSTARPDYLGFASSATEVTLRFDVAGSTKTVSIALDDGRRVTGVDRRGAAAVPRSDGTSTNVVGDAWIGSTVEGDGMTVEFARFWTGPIPSTGGDVCTVTLFDRDGRFILERDVPVDGPTVEAARDGIVGVEISALQDASARPEVRCTTWEGPGYVADGAATAMRAAPDQARPSPTSERTTWVRQRLVWKGRQFPGVWRCTARVLTADANRVVARGTEHFLHPPAEAPTVRTVAIPVPYGGGLSPVTPVVDCSPVNLEAGG